MTTAAARVSRGAAGQRRRQTLATALLCLLAISALHAAPQVRLRTAGRSPVPIPESLAARVETQGRTSRLVEMEIADVGQRVPRTFSRHLIGNTEGFGWYVSRHFALKTDLPEAQVRETLALLELGLPQLEAIFGASTAALADRRMAFVFASGRQALRRAMADDDLHVLNLGGITQEGYWGAYQYAGSSYQNRYIILHEFAHLFQYAVAGSTRHCYGFFVEGIADFFSSHVFDPERQQLTVNVLDRAPMHNHLAAGLVEWKRRQCPPLSKLYAEGATTRGLDVLMTAFLQSTPEREIKWRLFCNESLCRGRPDQDPRQLSDELMAALYGGWPALDRGFAAWMERLPTFDPLDYGFDQRGEALVSQEPLPGRKARLRLNPTPLARRAADAFTLDYPRPAAHRRLPSAATNAFSLAFTLCPPERPPSGRLELLLGGEAPVLRVSVSNGQQIVLATPSSNWTCALPQQPPSGSGSAEIEVLLDVTPDAARLSLLRGPAMQPRAHGSMPLAPGQFVAAGDVPAELAATCGGYRLIPWFPEDAVPCPADPQPPVRQAWRPLASRFGTPDAAGPIFRALRALGAEAPDMLRIAGHMLLADAVSAHGDKRRLPDDELLSEAFWHGLAEAIRASAAGEAARQEALTALADTALEMSLVPSDNGGGDAAIVLLRRPAIGAWRGSLSLCMDGLHLQTRALRGRRADTEEEVRLPLPGMVRAGVHTVTAKAEVTWLGQPLTLQRRVVANPGIPRWHVVGPFMLPEGVFTNSVFPPELEAPNMGRLFAAPDGTQMHWRRVEPPPGHPLETDHLIHFAKGFRRQANFAAAYAAAFFDCEAAMPATLTLGASDGVQVWLNGKCVLTDMRPREWAPRNVRVPVELARGANTLLVKSLHSDGLWFLSGRIEDREGRPLRGLGY